MFADYSAKKLIGDIDEIIISKGTTITASQTIKGDIPVVAAGIKPAYYHNESNWPGNVITVSASGANAGYINYWDRPIFASDCNVIESTDANKVNIVFLFYALLQNQQKLFESQKGNAQPHVYADDIKSISIPFPAILMQNQFASYVEEIDKLKFAFYGKNTPAKTRRG